METILKGSQIYTFIQVANLPLATWEAIGGTSANYFEMIESAKALHDAEVVM